MLPKNVLLNPGWMLLAALMLLPGCATPLPPQLPAVVTCPLIPPLPPTARLAPRSETYLQRVQRNIEKWESMLKTIGPGDSKPMPITTP